MAHDALSGTRSELILKRHSQLLNETLGKRNFWQTGGLVISKGKEKETRIYENCGLPLGKKSTKMRGRKFNDMAKKRKGGDSANGCCFVK